MPDAVSIVRCENYEVTAVMAAIQKALSYLGGIEAFVKPGDRVLLKPNLLSDSKPETAIITHPAMIDVMVKMVRGAGGIPIIADSPGAGIAYTASALKKVYQAAVYDKIAQNANGLLNFDTTWSLVANPEAKLVKRLEVISPALNCSKIINLPKFKTHTFTIFSGAVKNMFGIVPGFVKPGYHARLRDADHFSELLLDLITRIKPNLNIMDGIMGIEGDGPGSLGSVRKIGLIMASVNAILLDAVAAKLAGFDVQTIPVLAAAKKRGQLKYPEEEIKVFGGGLDDFKIPDFQKPKTFDPQGFGFRPAVQKLITPIVKNIFSLKPIVQKSRCTGCANCARGCPTQVIKIIKLKAKINYSDCIRCYCCIEGCPNAAIEAQLPWYTRFLYLTGVMGLFQKARLEKTAPH